MSYVVLGGAGFLGSFLCDALVEKGADVVCVDNLFTGSLNNIKTHIGKSYFKFVEHDVTSPLNYLGCTNVEGIFNLACPASPIHYQIDPIKTIHTNILGTMHAISYAEKYCSFIFQASTSEVYGDPTVHPQIEEYWGNVNPIGIRSCYDEGKRCAESLLFDHHRQNGTRIKVARIFNTYGPRMNINDGRVISNFIIQALENKDITIYGSGEQTRSFCYVSDLISGILKLTLNTKDCVTGPINLGSPSEMSMIKIAEKILKITKSKSSLVFLPLPGDDPKQRQPDITKAQQVLDWNPCVDIDDGLIKTINYFKNAITLK